MQCNISTNQVLISCSTPEEAENLRKAIENVPMDTLDDLVNSMPILKNEIGNLKKEIADFTDITTKLIDENIKLEKENLKLKAKSEKPLGDKVRKSRKA